MNLSWIFQGVEYILDDGHVAWHIGNDGFGMAPVERYESRGPQQHGSTDEGYQLLPRVLELAAAVHGDSWPNLFEGRHILLNIFKPSNLHGTLRWQLGGITRDIDAHCVGGLTFATTDRVGLVQKFGVILRANDPTWYDPAAVTVTFSMGPSGEGMPVPTPVPTPIGASSIGQVEVIIYTGTAISYPHVIRIEGPILNPVITNLTTGKKLDFTGINLGAGEYFLIDLTYNQKTVVDNLGANRISTLSLDSDLSSFSIQPSPEASGGINEIQVTGDSTNSLTRLDLVYYIRDIGI